MALGLQLGYHSPPSGVSRTPIIESDLSPSGPSIPIRGGQIGKGSDAEGVRPGGESMREYELNFIIQPEISEEGSAAILARLDAELESGSERLCCDDLGKRKLAYEIQKFQKGHYYLLSFLDAGPVVPHLERLLRLEESVLRFLTVKVSDNVVDVEARKAEAAEREAELKRRAVERAEREAEEARAREEAEEEQRQAAAQRSAEAAEQAEAESDGEEAAEASAESAPAETSEGSTTSETEAPAATENTEASADASIEEDKS